MKSLNRKQMLAAVAMIALVSISAFAAQGAAAYAKGNGNSGHRSPSQMQADEQKERMAELRPEMTDHRFISVFGNDNFAYFLSVKTGNSSSAFALRIQDEGVPTITTFLGNLTKDQQNITADWVTGVLSVRGLVEYNDTNGDGVYTEGNDTRLQSVNFSNLDWSLSTTKLTVNGTQGWNITLTAGDRGATYTISTQIFNTGATLSDGTPIAPNEAKVNFIFHDFPWESNSSRLALTTLFGGQQGDFSVTRTDNQTEAVLTKNAFAYFTWASTATVDNSTVSVVSSSQNQGTAHLIEFNYPHGTNITHDPVIGVGTGSVQSIPSYRVASSIVGGAAPLPGFDSVLAGVIVVAGMAALFFTARRKMLEPKLPM